MVGEDPTRHLLGGTPRGSMIDLVLVDFDDTLVETAPAFHRAREVLFKRLAAEGFERERASRIHYEVVEPELLSLFGMGPFRLEPSFRDTYLRLCVAEGRLPDPGVARECGKLGRGIMDHAPVLHGALDALERLARRLPTIIYSQASHPEYQMDRIREAGVTEIVPEARVHITHKKTRETFQEALLHFGVRDPAGALMIGNSLRSDINPALEAGAAAVLVEPYEMWEYDVVPPFSQDFLRFRTFPDAVEHVLDNGQDP
jgi:putative hydrolase of the HAD superfamily